jgi:hypothetical protein
MTGHLSKLEKAQVDADNGLRGLGRQISDAHVNPPQAYALLVALGSITTGLAATIAGAQTATHKSGQVPGVGVDGGGDPDKRVRAAAASLRLAQETVMEAASHIDAACQAMSAIHVRNPATHTEPMSTEPMSTEPVSMAGENESGYWL